MKIEAVITGDRELTATLTSVPGRLHRRLVTVMTRLGITLQRHVKQDKLSGQVLKNRTGHLRASIAHETTDGEAGIVTRVGVFQGPTVIYGRAHEFGFKGVVTVRAHVRNIKQAFGRPIAPRSVNVRAHSANLNVKERSFLRTAFAEMRGEIVGTLDREVAAEVARGSA